MTSIQELNKELAALNVENNHEVSVSSEKEIDIAFIAGILLWYRIEGINDLTLRFSGSPEKTITIYEYSDEDIYNTKTISFCNAKHFNALITYLRQYNELYPGIKVRFICLDNVGEEMVIWPSRVFVPGFSDTFHLSYAPILYINSDTIDEIFGNSNKYIYNKEKYITELIRRATSNKNEKDYFVEANEGNSVIKYLRTGSFIHALVFTIVYEKTKPFVNNNKKEGEELVGKLWQFTQDYVRCLHELAKNIVEHSAGEFGKGVGVITIRAYQKDEKSKNRDLETHVFDYGTIGIIPKFVNDTNSKAETEPVEDFKKCYVDDAKFFKDNRSYSLKNYIAQSEGKLLEQQQFRHSTHYGISILHSLLKTLDGEMAVRSTGLDGTPDIFPERDEGAMLDRGTHYYIRVHFERENFGAVKVREFNRGGQRSVLGQSESFRDFSEQYASDNVIKLNALKDLPTKSNIKLLIVDDLETEKITKENVDDIYKKLNKLNDLNEVATVAINIHGKINDASILLRFLSRLTVGYKKQSLIVYGVNYKDYTKLLKDNHQFFETRREQDYWHEDRAILLFVKEEENNFYFADILYGKQEGHFLWVNQNVNQTFPNTITIYPNYKEDSQETKPISITKPLDDFFLKDSNMLLPFDAILKNSDGKELILSNLKTLLNNRIREEEEEKKEEKYEGISGEKGYIKNIDGYHIESTHFRVGNKVHSKDFYYAKRLFQNSFYTARLAMILALKIKSAAEKLNDKDELIIPPNRKILLVGYEMYSELLLSLVSKFLKEAGYANIRHCVGIDNNEKFAFKPDTNFYKDDKGLFEDSTAIIIVPIASTGSTAAKIKTAIQEHVKIAAKSVLTEEGLKDDELQTRIKQQSESINFPIPSFNVLIARDKDEKFKRMMVTEQKHLIELDATWYFPEECDLCWGAKGAGFNGTETLFVTDKTYLTPALIFHNPQGKLIANNGNDKYKISIDKATLSKTSLFYKTVNRNNEFFLFSINSPQFIEDNNKHGEIVNWLKEVGAELENETKGDGNKVPRIVILAPCHETNSEFMNMVNEHVFHSSATIIHHQSEGEYMENFRLLNKYVLGDKENEVKVFYVDDNLISGRQFSNIYRLFRDTVNNKLRLSGGILLRDCSTRETHDRFRRSVGKCYVYASYNLPPSLSFDSDKPLEHERKRYHDLREFALHDVLIRIFDDKERELNTHEEATLHRKGDVNGEKHRRHLKMLLIIDLIYKYFAEGKTISHSDDKTLEDTLYPNIRAGLPPGVAVREDTILSSGERDEKDTKIQLLKVLSQYPFLLYKEIKEEAFHWHKHWLEELLCKVRGKLEWAKQEQNQNKYDIGKFSIEDRTNIFSYDDFCELKFLIRRAIFLDNYQIIDLDSLSLLADVFNLIDKKPIKFKPALIKERRRYKTIYISDELDDSEEKNLKEFHIFLVRIFLELAHKNGWTAVKLLDNIDNDKVKFDTPQARQFVRMLKIELTAVVNGFNLLITSSYETDWRDCYKDSKKELDRSTNGITKFFKEHWGDIMSKAKFDIALRIIRQGIKIKPLLNYYWIKQMIFNDTHKNTQMPKIDLQEKVNEIMRKLKSFWDDKDDKQHIEAFLITTDKQDEAYVVYDDNNNMHHFEGMKPPTKDSTKEYEEQWVKNEFNVINRVLYGLTDTQDIMVESIKEFRREDDRENKKWIDVYTNDTKIKTKGGGDESENITLTFLPGKIKYLLLIRFSLFENHEQRNLGLVGFCCDEDLSDKPQGLLARRLLMLLRRDIGKFILAHHKNDEFAALRALESIHRFTYLAGHGRQSMLRLASGSDYFRDTIATMDKLQYLYASNRLGANNIDHKEELRRIFLPTDIRQVTKNGEDKSLKDVIEEFIKRIYESEDIENRVEISFAPNHDSKETRGVVNVNIPNEFNFSQDILLFILFELIINGKKNRWHCLNNIDARHEKCKNRISIDIKQEDDTLKIKIETTGTEVMEDIREKINKGNPVKSGLKNEGIYLISTILINFDFGNSIIMCPSKPINSDLPCLCPKKCSPMKNTFVITIKQAK
jgi:hypothetical protein